VRAVAAEFAQESPPRAIIIRFRAALATVVLFDWICGFGTEPVSATAPMPFSLRSGGRLMEPQDEARTITHAAGGEDAPRPAKD
jgi:hypothetical protein